MVGKPDILAPAQRHSLAAAQATEILVCDIYHIEPIKDFI